MKTIQKGEKISLDKEIGSREFLVVITWDQSNHPNYEVDASVMLLSERGKLEEESDFVFYNNPNSFNNEINLSNEKISGYQKVFNANLNKSNNNISKMMFLLTIEDGDALNRRLGDLKNIKIDILDKNSKSVLISYQVTDLTKETALILADIYKRNDEWRIQPRGEGFNSGLSSIIKEYGSEKVQVSEEEVKVEPPKEPIKLEKTPKGTIDFVKKHNERINLVKREISLQKLDNTKAQIVIALDISFSMQPLFKSGLVQDTFDKVLPLAMQFDDDGEVDVWVFHDKSFNHKNSYNPENRENYINNEILKSYDWGSTNYSLVFKGIGQKYSNAGKNQPPVFVLFFTDGDCMYKKQSEKEIKNVSAKGIFWKFIGLGGGRNSFDFLQKLDDLSDRVVDNADFIHVPDIKTVKDEDLYKLLLQEFSSWIQNAKSKNIIQ